MKGPQILIVLGSFAAGALGFFLVLEWGDLPILPGGRYADRREQAQRTAPKTAQEAANSRREAERLLGQEALRQIEHLSSGLPALELPPYDRTPRNLQDLLSEAPELTEKFVKADGLKEFRGCRPGFRSFVERQFNPEAVIRERGWNREARRSFWHKLHVAECTHEHAEGGG